MTAEQKLQMVPVGDIVCSPDNARKIDEKCAEFIELVESIKAGGLRVPVHVRPVTPGGSLYELRAGERRYRAAMAAGLDTIPAIVHTCMDDGDAMDLTYIENKYRVDLKPMEEAAAIEKLAFRFGGDIAAIAAKLGVTERWVRLRANITAKLIGPWKKAIENNTLYASWTVTHLIQIARLPACRQKELLKDTDNYHLQMERCSAADLERHITREMRLLSGARWDLDDQTLIPKAGPCRDCVKRTGYQPMLWFDSEQQAAAGDKCLDSRCYDDKGAVWLARQAAELKRQHPKLVNIVKGYPDYRQSETIEKKIGPYLRDYNYKIVSKSAKGAVPAVCVFGKGEGKLTYIRPASGPGTSGRIQGQKKTLKEKRAGLEAKRWSQVLIDLQQKVEETTVAGIHCTDRVTAVMAMVAFQGNCSIGHEIKGDLDAEMNRLLADKKEGKFAALEYLWRSFKPTLKQSLTYAGPITQTPKQYIKEAEWIAGIIGADLKAMFKDVSKGKGFCEPKSWKEEEKVKSVKKVKSGKKVKSEKVKGKKSKVQTCRICGYQETDGNDDGGAHRMWIEEDLCSNCKEMI